MPIECKCQSCGKTFYVNPRTLKRGGGKYCSRTCYAKARQKVFKVDNKTFLNFYNKYIHLMKSVAKKHSLNRDFIKDLFQEECISLMKIASKNIDGCSYIYRALNNTCLRYVNKNRQYSDNVYGVPFDELCSKISYTEDLDYIIDNNVA